MIRGLLLGTVWGAVVSGVLLAAAAVFAPEVRLDSTPPEDPAGSAPDSAAEDGVDPSIDVVPENDAVPEPSTVQGGDAAPIAETTATEPTAAPELAVEDPVSEPAPDASGESGVTESAQEARPQGAASPLAEVAPDPGAVNVGAAPAAVAEPGAVDAVLDAPDNPADADVSAPPPSTTGEEVALAEPDAPLAPALEATPDPGTELIGEPEVAPEVDLNAPPTAEPDARIEAAIATPAPDAREPEAPISPDLETAPEPTSPPDREPEVAVDVALEPPAPEEEADAPAVEDDVATAPVPDPALPPAPPMTFSPPVIVTPGLGPPTAADDPAPSDSAKASPSGPAIDAHAAPYTPGSDMPRLGIVLLGTAGPPPLELEELSIPVAVALDPLSAETPLRMTALREIGVEVLALTPLPDGATPSDVEISFQAFLEAVPEAVAVMDVPEVMLQQNRPRAAQVVGIVKSSGHGLVTYDRGFNAILQIADQEAVPALRVSGVFDTGASDANQMKQALDRAAFDAGRQGRALFVGALRPEAVEALRLWAIGTRAATVEVAPVSAVLKGE